jgi:membrane protease YdiL (CAAX protease family)
MIQSYAMTSRPRLLLEWSLLYLIAPGAIALVSAGHRWVVLASIVASSALSIALLFRDPTWPRAQLTTLAGFRQELLPMLLRAVLAMAALLLFLLATGRWPAFSLPRRQPLLWLGVLALYPWLSALPQEVMFRALHFHRYGSLFPTPAARASASALVFGWAHVLVHNGPAMLLAALAGALLSLTWLRSRSLWLVGLEHTLYGALVFTAGVGGMFVNGIRIVSSLMH